jgi:hypothetical protein
LPDGSDIGVVVVAAGFVGLRGLELLRHLGLLHRGPWRWAAQRRAVRMWEAGEGRRAWAYWKYSANDCFMPWVSSMVSQRLRPPPKRAQRGQTRSQRRDCETYKKLEGAELVASKEMCGRAGGRVGGPNRGRERGRESAEEEYRA